MVDFVLAQRCVVKTSEVRTTRGSFHDSERRQEVGARPSRFGSDGAAAPSTGIILALFQSKIPVNWPQQCVAKIKEASARQGRQI